MTTNLVLNKFRPNSLRLQRLWSLWWGWGKDVPGRLVAFQFGKHWAVVRATWCSSLQMCLVILLIIKSYEHGMIKFYFEETPDLGFILVFLATLGSGYGLLLQLNVGGLVESCRLNQGRLDWSRAITGAQQMVSSVDQRWGQATLFSLLLNRRNQVASSLWNEQFVAQIMAQLGSKWPTKHDESVQIEWHRFNLTLIPKLTWDWSDLQEIRRWTWYQRAMGWTLVDCWQGQELWAFSMEDPGGPWKESRHLFWPEAEYPSTRTSWCWLTVGRKSKRLALVTPWTSLKSMYVYCRSAWRHVPGAAHWLQHMPW